MRAASWCGLVLAGGVGVVGCASDGSPGTTPSSPSSSGLVTAEGAAGDVASGGGPSSGVPGGGVPGGGVPGGGVPGGGVSGSGAPGSMTVGGVGEQPSGSTSGGPTANPSTPVQAGGAPGSDSAASTSGGTTGSAPTASGSATSTMAVDAGNGGMSTAGGGGNAGTGGMDSSSGGMAVGAGGAANPGDELCPYAGGAEPTGTDWVNGEMLEFNDNGGWCWYQDERVLVDQETGQLIIASVGSGGNRDARVEVVHWDIANKTGELHHLGTMSYADDHDVAALVKRPEGGYVAMWAGHNDDCNSYFSVYDGGSWSQSRSFAWPQCPTSSGKRITYANLWYLGDTLYSYVRSIDTSPHYLFSEDGGNTWELSGRLTSTPQVGYVAGYYKYWGNNSDRIDFFGTEAHPRDNDNSLYHGYVADGQIHNSNGEVVDTNFADTSANEVSEYTQVFATGTTINGVQLEHMWNADMVRYDDGTVAAIGTGRVSGTGSDDPDKRLLYFRFDGTEWKTTYLAKAGTKLYSSEQDYTGLGALHPDNPNVIYISTAFDPRTDEGEFNGKKEIWKGVTCDGGATFDWEPVTSNSQMDNLRPVVPKWDASHTALLWLRGTYTSAQSYNFKVVGLIEGED
jgi:hypothetical protein